jgi:hypothetical protein
MKTFDELVNTEEPRWAVVEEWLRKATNPVEVLPPVEANRKSALGWHCPRMCEPKCLLASGEPTAIS